MLLSVAVRAETASEQVLAVLLGVPAAARKQLSQMLASSRQWQREQCGRAASGREDFRCQGSPASSSGVAGGVVVVGGDGGGMFLGRFVSELVILEEVTQGPFFVERSQNMFLGVCFCRDSVCFLLF